MFIWMADCVPWTKGRGLLGKETTFSEVDLKLMGVPKDAELLLQSESACGDQPPVHHKPQLALQCQLNVKTRACLNVSSMAPYFKGTCSGQRCTMDFAHKPSTCFFNNFGVDVDLKNASRNATCGFKPEDSSWLVPAANPFTLRSMSNDSSCSSAIPPSARSEMWAPCVNGEPQLRVRLVFQREMAENYSCILTPTCVNGTRHSRLVCFITKAQQFPTSRERNSASRTHRQFGLSSFTLAAFFVLKLLVQ
ncbi:hypothetical protein BSKO_12759 [Bryopsis sp. KO-2023]|nr:hypothetical protein BSKO_12759 [Bryopsis sp. KO-2023]